eukprot:scaffold7234_cov335-Prasinococcus_capsulatus_cf.AAC.2
MKSTAQILARPLSEWGAPSWPHALWNVRQPPGSPPRHMPGGDRTGAPGSGDGLSGSNARCRGARSLARSGR